MLHSAADEISAGRLSDRDAPQMITATLLSAYTLPADATVPPEAPASPARTRPGPDRTA